MRNRQAKRKKSKQGRGQPRSIPSSFLSFTISLLPALALLCLIGLLLFAPTEKPQLTARLVTESSANVEEVDRATRLASNYLARQIKTNGQFVYRINLDTIVRVKPRYNILRHAGTVYALGAYH